MDLKYQYSKTLRNNRLRCCVNQSGGKRGYVNNGHIWNINADLVIFDEIHKMKNWKAFLKGAYDAKPKSQSLLITGSARMETFRQSGESLAGRYFHHRLLPISVKEAESHLPPAKSIIRLNTVGGFPEPFLDGTEETAARWQISIIPI